MDKQRLDNHDIELPWEFESLPVFAVGGWVRDKIRGVEPTDVDLMVAEATPEEMVDRGFQRIDSPNNDTFGVFQDSLGREVALAREEESTGDGHRDFEVVPVEPTVEASEAAHRDLKRRDFTVNAMAFDLRWNVLLDPHNGLHDLEQGKIRAVSSKSFQEDPLRIVRGARFAARLDSEIEGTTLELMRDSANSLNALPEERTRMELEKALVQADKPSKFFEWLDRAHALSETFPEIEAMQDIPAGPEEWHQEGDVFNHTMMVLDEMSDLRPDDSLGALMAIAHDMGKTATPDDELPSHPGHEKVGVDIVKGIAERLSMSNEQERAMVEASRFHMRFHDIEDLRESTVIETWEQMDNFDRLVALMIADELGRRPQGEPDTTPVIGRFSAAKQACEEWTGQRLIEEGYEPEEMGGEEFGNLLHQKRVEHMRELEA